MKVVSLILARGGSKGIPQKNIYPVNGIPLINYTIKASLGSNTQETYVSTDCIEIKNKAIKAGAKVIDRPFSLSTDLSKSDDSLIHFANIIDFDILVFIQPTSPLISFLDINIGIKMINESCDSVFSAHEEHWIPRWTKSGQPFNWSPKNRPMRQEVEEFYVENGAFYITKRKNLIKSKLRYSGRIKPCLIPFNRGFQIDTLEDVKIISKLLK